MATVHAQAMDRAQAQLQVRLYLHRIALAERTVSAHNPSQAMALLTTRPRNRNDPGMNVPTTPIRMIPDTATILPIR